MKYSLLSLLPLLLTACATTDSTTPAPPPQSVASAPSGSKITEAVSTPLSDLGLVHASIPPVLADALKGPYAVPADMSCPNLSAQVLELEAVLGADLDTPPGPSDPGLVERGQKAAGDAAMRAVKGAAEGVVPYRGWVRKLSGAERYSRQVAAAVAAGTVRRAYLKGLGQARGCEAPAAPRAAVATK